MLVAYIFKRTGSLIRIECGLSDNVVAALMKDGLDVGAYQKPCSEWRERREVITRDAEKMRAERMAEWDENPPKNPGILDKEVMAYLVRKVLEKYP